MCSHRMFRVGECKAVLTMLTAGLLFVSIATPHATKAFVRQLCCFASLTPMVSFKQAAQAHKGGSFLLQLNQKIK